MTSRDSERYIIGTATGLLADQLYFVALGWTAAEANGGSGTSIVLTAGAAARLLVLLLGGVVADRVGPKTLAVGSDLARASLMAIAGLTILAGNLSLPVLIALSVTFGVVDAMFIPAVGALPGQFSTGDQTTRLQSTRLAAQRFSLILGAPLAGFLLGVSGFVLVLGINTLLFLTSATLLSRIHLPDVEAEAKVSEGSLWAEMVSGFRYVSSRPVLRAVILLTAMTELCLAGAFNVGLPLLSLQRGWGPEGVGLLIGAFGVGAAAAAVVVATRGIRSAGKVACGSIAAIGPGLATAAVTSDLAVALAAFALTGIAAGLCSPLLVGLATTLTSPEIQGKVMSLLALASFAGVPISYALTGWLVGRFGIELPFVLSGSAALLVGAVAIAAGPIRKARLP
jgi:MFS family permease